MRDEKYIEQCKGDTVNDIINHCAHYVKQRMTQQTLCFNVEGINIEYRETFIER